MLVWALCQTCQTCQTPVKPVKPVKPDRPSRPQRGVAQLQPLQRAVPECLRRRRHGLLEDAGLECLLMLVRR